MLKNYNKMIGGGDSYNPNPPIVSTLGFIASIIILGIVVLVLGFITLGKYFDWIKKCRSYELNQECQGEDKDKDKDTCKRKIYEDNNCDEVGKLAIVWLIAFIVCFVAEFILYKIIKSIFKYY